MEDSFSFASLCLLSILFIQTFATDNHVFQCPQQSQLIHPIQVHFITFIKFISPPISWINMNLFFGACLLVHKKLFFSQGENDQSHNCTLLFPYNFSYISSEHVFNFSFPLPTDFSSCGRMKRESKKRRRRFSKQKNSKENLNATVHCFEALNLFSPQAPQKKPKAKKL